jgi:AhpD family alkylhydroperoxidase
VGLRPATHIMSTFVCLAIALAIGVTAHCKGCIAFHTQAALQADASPAEIMEALGVAIAMGGGPALMYASYAVEAMEELQNRTE